MSVFMQVLSWGCARLKQRQSDLPDVNICVVTRES